MVARPCRRRRPSSLDDGGISGLFTAKGGIAIAIESELGIPVKYVGVGEKIYDLQKFDADTFVDALFDVNVEEEV